MKIIFLGTNGWYTTPTGDTPSILIDSKDQYVILDAGNGIYKLDQFITDAKKPISLFISHFHLDHISGVHTLLPKFSFPQGINIYVGRGRKKDFDTISNPPFAIGYEPDPSHIHSPGTKYKVQELEDGKNDLGFPVTVIEQFHGYRGHGYRLELEGKTIAYTGDCGLTDAARKLSANVDVFICECSNKKNPEPDTWGHFDPYMAANLAKETGVKKLILTHFGTNHYPTLEDRKWAEEEARKIFPDTTAAYDLSEFEV